MDKGVRNGPFEGDPAFMFFISLLSCFHLFFLNVFVLFFYFLCFFLTCFIGGINIRV